MNGPVVAETAQASDIDAWLRLVLRTAENFPGLDMSDYADILIKNIGRGTALCVRAQNGLAGVLLFSPARRSLSFLAVDPALRRHGVATALIRRMLALMPEGNVEVVTFREGDEKGTAARALYRRFGFVPAELFYEFGYPVQRFVLRRD